MVNLIGISGKIGSGKDLVAEIIQFLTSKYIHDWDVWESLKCVGNGHSEWQNVKFADKLKDIICILLNCTRYQLEDRSFKERELPENWWFWRNQLTYEIVPYNGVHSFINYTQEYANQFKLIKPTPRFLLQYIGTDLFRNQLHPNTWINATMADYICIEKNNTIKCSKWIISDVRFPNEADIIKKYGGINIRLKRNSYTPKTDIIHISESALDNYEFDCFIDNNGTIKELIEKVKQILIKYNIKCTQ